MKAGARAAAYVRPAAPGRRNERSEKTAAEKGEWKGTKWKRIGEARVSR